MGSITGLRSQALALRAQEDTKLQVSGYLGNVNKGLGGQISGLMDGLQSVISERTKAYNAIVAKLNQTTNGKGSIGEQSVSWSFAIIKSIINTTQAAVVAINVATSSTAAAVESTNSAPNTSYAQTIVLAATAPPYDVISAGFYSAAIGIEAASAAAKNSGSAAANTLGVSTQAQAVIDVAAEIATLTTTVMQAVILAKTIESLRYDYEKMTGQLGFTEARAIVDGQPIIDSTASRILKLRDAIMPRYKPKQGIASYDLAYDRGYVGTLERI